MADQAKDFKAVKARLKKALNDTSVKINEFNSENNTSLMIRTKRNCLKRNSRIIKQSRWISILIQIKELDIEYNSLPQLKKENYSKKVYVIQFKDFRLEYDKKRKEFFNLEDKFNSIKLKSDINSNEIIDKNTQDNLSSNYQKLDKQDKIINEITKTAHITEKTAENTLIKMRNQREKLNEGIQLVKDSKGDINKTRIILTRVSRREYCYKYSLYLLIALLAGTIFLVLIYRIKKA